MEERLDGPSPGYQTREVTVMPADVAGIGLKFETSVGTVDVLTNKCVRVYVQVFDGRRLVPG